MINLLTINESVDFTFNLLNQITRMENGIRPFRFCNNGKDLIQYLNTEDRLDIILADYNLLFYDDKCILNYINEEKYQKKFILFADKSDDISLLNNKMIYAILLKTASIDKIGSKIDDLLEGKDIDNNLIILRQKIINELEYLGYDLRYKGTKYLIRAIMFVAQHPEEDLDQLESTVYPNIADACNNTVHNIKCNINRATNMMYFECEFNKLQHYFCMGVDERPRTKTIIHTVINNITKNKLSKKN